MSIEAQNMNEKLWEHYEAGEQIASIPDNESEDFFCIDENPNGSYSAYLCDGQTKNPIEAVAIKEPFHIILHVIANRSAPPNWEENANDDALEGELVD